MFIYVLGPVRTKQMMRTLTAVPLALVLLLVLVGLSKFGTAEEIELRHRSSPPAAGSKELTKVSS